MISIEYPQDGPCRGRIHGLDICPGISELGHGLTMRLLHDATCCAEWEAGETPWPKRADEWRKIAGRRGSTWPPSA